MRHWLYTVSSRISQRHCPCALKRVGNWNFSKQILIPNWRISICDELDKRKLNAKSEKERLTPSSTDWYSIEIQQRSTQRVPIVFPIRKLEELPTLKSLKIERLKKEAHEFKLLKEEITTLLMDTESFITQGKVKDAKEALDAVRNKIIRIKDANIRKHYIQAQEALTKLENTLEKKDLHE